MDEFHVGSREIGCRRIVDFAHAQETVYNAGQHVGIFDHSQYKSVNIVITTAQDAVFPHRFGWPLH
jgi:hypothetical protein